MKKLGLIAAMAAAFTPTKRDPLRVDRPVKKCIVCGKKHTHNNSFCSAQCCKEHVS